VLHALSIRYKILLANKPMEKVHGLKYLGKWTFQNTVVVIYTPNLKFKILAISPKSVFRRFMWFAC
jgi:hypothetical protein